MEENKVVEMENQVEVAEETQAPVAVVEDMLPTENVEETEKPAVPGVVLGAGVVLGGIALYKGVKLGLRLDVKQNRTCRGNWIIGISGKQTKFLLHVRLPKRLRSRLISRKRLRILLNLRNK